MSHLAVSIDTASTALWTRGRGRARAGMEREQSEMYQMPNPLPADPARFVGAAWVSPSDRGEHKATAFSESCNR
jgi:hypothetical protein